MGLTHMSKKLCLLVCWLDIINSKASIVDLSCRPFTTLPSISASPLPLPSVPGDSKSKYNLQPQVAQSHGQDRGNSFSSVTYQICK